MNWDDIRLFLAIARAPSFSAAARKLGINQSTVSRRLAAMERDLGTQLIDRSPEGHSLTDAGNELRCVADNVEEELICIERSLSGHDAHLSGHLSVTCVDMLVDRYLAPHFAKFSKLHPDIDLHILTPFQPLNLVRREADVAIRVTDNPPESLIGRRICAFAMGVYGSIDFVETIPENPDPAEINWIGWSSETYHRRMITDHYPQARARHRVDSLLVLNSLVRAGIGASVCPCYWADAEASLRRIYSKPLAANELSLWVLVHPDVRRAARVRAFSSFISDAFRAESDLFEGRRPARPTGIGKG